MRFLVLFILVVSIVACKDQSATSPKAEDAAVEPASDAAAKASPADASVEKAEASAGEIPNRHEPMPGIVTGAQPDQEAIAKLEAEGVKTVINLRLADEFEEFDEQKAVEAAGLNYVSIPVDKKEGLTRENVEKVHEALENAPEGGVLLHCGSSNRAAAMLALRAHWIEGKDSDEALELGTKAGLTKLEPRVKALMEEKKPSE